jgi:peptide-methionine (S)-S-oxide reductase
MMKTSKLFRIAALLAAAPAAIAFLLSYANADESPRAVPPPKPVSAGPAKPGLETAVLAGGCFWGVEGVFQHVKGVAQVVAGYSGGAASTAHYPMVGTETTGHAESVKITYDPKQIGYGELLRVFFSAAHDPTELNRQGPDEGSSYRSAIFTANAEQEKIARAYIAQLNAAHVYGAPIVTTVEPLKGFYPAEEYHQDFLARNPTYPYIVVNDLPKIESLKRLLPADYRAQPVTGVKGS